MDLAAVLRREQAEVEKIDVELRGGELVLDEAGEAEGLRDLARAGAVVARRAADDERARPRDRIGPRRLRAVDAGARLDPVDREVVVGVGVTMTTACAATQRS